MCGIVFLYGPRAGIRLPDCLKRLRHRGPDDTNSWIDGDVALGFNRLAINGDGEIGRQPYHHGDFVGVFNGEIYNHQTLSRNFGLPSSDSDTQILLPLLSLRGVQAIDDIDGFFSGVVFQSSTREVICLRDHIGKKPLFVGKSGSELFIVSELKALDEIDWFELLPRGFSRVDIVTGQVTLLAEHSPLRPQESLASIFEHAVRKRLPSSDQPVGVFLSGGLDSSLVASVVSRFRPDAIYFILGSEGHPDRDAVDFVVASLGLRDVRIIPLPPPESIPELLRSVVYATESFNPSIVSNGLATYLLAKAAHEAGIKVVLTGEGADELFGGYHYLAESDPWRDVRSRLINDMQFTELRRLDMSCMAHSVEARCPFLDRAIRGFSDGLEFSDMYELDANKISLRRSFEDRLPPEIIVRRKTSFDVGSGIRGEVVGCLRSNGRSEREELREIWGQIFSYKESAPYFHSYPVFDSIIDQRGAVHK